MRVRYITFKTDEAWRNEFTAKIFEILPSGAHSFYRGNWPRITVYYIFE